MDFNFTQDENDFRQEIKDWLSKNLSQRISVSYTHLRAHETQ